MDILGIDIGGSGIKGFPVNCDTGEPLAERFRVETPQPAKPDLVAQAVKQLVEHFDWKKRVGCGFPAAVQNGIIKTAANIDKSWIGVNAEALFHESTGLQFRVRNDADVAGVAELAFGAGKDQQGVVILLTIGTGIGTVIFNNGTLMPNTELGHLEFKGDIAEKYVSDAARKRDKLKWKPWAKRLNEYLVHLDKLFYPDFFIIGGGVSKKMEKFSEFLTIKTPIVPARLKNDAGIIGAALAASV